MISREYYNVDRASLITGVRKYRLCRLLDKGIIAGFKFGKRWYIPDFEVHNLLAFTLRSKKPVCWKEYKEWVEKRDQELL